MIGEPVVASVEEQQSRIPVVFNAKPHPTLHSFRYTFEPEGVDKSCGVLVPPEPGTSDGMVVFGGLNKVMITPISSLYIISKCLLLKRQSLHNRLVVSRKGDINGFGLRNQRTIQGLLSTSAIDNRKQYTVSHFPSSFFIFIHPTNTL